VTRHRQRTRRQRLERARSANEQRFDDLYAVLQDPAVQSATEQEDQEEQELSRLQAESRALEAYAHVAAENRAAMSALARR
jgi:hypothetical protein